MVIDMNDDLAWPCYCKFWRKLAPWFSERGYSIHCEFNSVLGCTVSPLVPNYTPSLPYSYYDNHESEEFIPPRSIHNGSVKLICAQEQQTREACIKLVVQDSDEFRIYEMLRNEPSAFDESNFCCVLPPIDFLYYGDSHVFVVSPRSKLYNIKR